MDQPAFDMFGMCPAEVAQEGLAIAWPKSPIESAGLQRRPTYKVSFLGGRVPLDLRFRGHLEAKSFVRGPKIDPPGPRILRYGKGADTETP